MVAEPHVLWLQDCSGECSSLVGGKAVGLGSLLRSGLAVPPGFVVTTGAFREHVDNNRLAAAIDRLVAESDSFEAQQRAAEEIRHLFENSRLSDRLDDEVRAAHQGLCLDNPQRPLAVRSSATAEDLADASFAGQQETYLWIIGADEALRHVVRCWASLFTPQALAYRAHRGVGSTELAMGVVLQQMVPASAAGVMLTIDPVNGDPSAIVIEACYGLGAAVVNGEVTPDRICVDKVTLEVRSRSIGSKTVEYRFDAAIQGTRLEPVSAAQQAQACISDDEVLQLARLGKQMEQAMGRAQDMEWAIGPGSCGPREVFLLQARPETVWSQRQRKPVTPAGATVMDSILRTMVGSPRSEAPLSVERRCQH